MAQGRNLQVARAEVSPERIGWVSEILRRHAPSPPDFARPGTDPPVGSPHALDFFFALTLQQFAFWYLDADRWGGSYVGRIGGEDRKGSDFIWAAGMRALRDAPARLAPAWWAAASDEEIGSFFAEDGGAVRIPWLADRVALGRGYGEWFRERGQGPRDLVAEANASERPIASLLASLAEIPGYAEDSRHRKKAMLLAFVLTHRPERFLAPRDPASLGPVVDYHVMRTALRTGLVEAEPSLAADLAARRRISPEDEAEVRAAVAEAMEALHRISNVSHVALDALFFAARRKCPEASGLARA